MVSSAPKAPEEFTTKLPWLALNMACMTWPALRTQLAQYVAAPGAVQRLQEEGIPLLEAALPGLTEKLEVVQQGQCFCPRDGASAGHSDSRNDPGRGRLS